MKLAKLNDVPLAVLERGVTRVQEHALKVMEFNSDWELINESGQTEPSINAIAIIGQTARGRAVCAGHAGGSRPGSAC